MKLFRLITGVLAAALIGASPLTAFAKVNHLSVSQIRQEGNDVWVYASVRNENEKSVLQTPLAEEISVLCEGSRYPAQECVAWGRTGEQLSYVIGIDTSYSISGEIFKRTKQSVANFISRLKDTEKVQLITLADTASPLTEMTSDREKLFQSLEELGSGTGEHHLSVGVEAALESCRQVLESGSQRAAVVIFTSGERNELQLSDEYEILSLCNQVRVPIYIIQLSGDSEADYSLAKRIAEQSGGMIFDGFQDGVEDTFLRVEDLIRNVCRISVEPEKDLYGKQNLNWSLIYKGQDGSAESGPYTFSLSLDGVTFQEEESESEKETSSEAVQISMTETESDREPSTDISIETQEVSESQPDTEIEANISIAQTEKRPTSKMKVQGGAISEIPETELPGRASSETAETELVEGASSETAETELTERASSETEETERVERAASELTETERSVRAASEMTEAELSVRAASEATETELPERAASVTTEAELPEVTASAMTETEALEQPASGTKDTQTQGNAVLVTSESDRPTGQASVEADENRRTDGESQTDGKDKKTGLDLDQIKNLITQNLSIVIAGLMVLVAVLIILIVILKGRGKKKKQAGGYSDPTFSSSLSIGPAAQNSSVPGTAGSTFTQEERTTDEYQESEKTTDEYQDSEKTIDEYSGYYQDDERTIDSRMSGGIRILFSVSFDGRTQTIERVLRNELILGRGDQCDVDVVLGTKSDLAKQTSREPAIIVNRPEGLFIKDNNSRNGTLVNGKVINEETPIRNDDILQLGKTVVRIQIDRDSI